MNRFMIRGQQLVAIFLVGCLLFNYPVLSWFSYDGMLWGIPVLFIYMFTSWTIVIGLMILIIEIKR